jgi:NAD-dependent SIR2 family protein deacetylase
MDEGLTDVDHSRIGGPGASTRRLAELIRGAGSVVALTGAGVSVPSGIPDFRSPGPASRRSSTSSRTVFTARS